LVEYLILSRQKLLLNILILGSFKLLKQARILTKIDGDGEATEVLQKVLKAVHSPSEQSEDLKMDQAFGSKEERRSLDGY